MNSDWINRIRVHSEIILLFLLILSKNSSDRIRGIYRIKKPTVPEQCRFFRNDYEAEPISKRLLSPDTVATAEITSVSV
jgi:hypothetical protein